MATGAHDSADAYPSRTLAETREKFARFWEDNYSALLMRVAWFVKDRHLAEDLLHDVFVSMLSRIELSQLPPYLIEEDNLVVLRAYVVQAIRFRLMSDYRTRYRERRTIAVPDERQCPASGNLTRDFQPWIDHTASKLSGDLKRIFLFVVQHAEEEPNTFWQLWASQHGYDVESERQRNRFDQARRRLRARLRLLGARELLFND